MNVFEYLTENKSSLKVGLPIELFDLIDERSVYDGNIDSLLEFLERPGLEHVRNARFVIEDVFNEENKIVLLYMKDIDKYDDFDLKQFAIKMKQLEAYNVSLEDKIGNAVDKLKKENRAIEQKSLADSISDRSMFGL